MKLVVYSEEDRIAKQVAAAFRGLDTMKRRAQFGDCRFLAHERVWQGAVSITDECGQLVEYPTALVAVSVGPDYEALLKALAANWSDAVRIQTWQPNSGMPRPKRLICFVPGSPVTVVIRNATLYWDGPKNSSQQRKLEADARRIALQIVETVFIRKDSWLLGVRAKATRPKAAKAKPRRPRRSLSLYFAGL